MPSKRDIDQAVAKVVGWSEIVLPNKDSLYDRFGRDPLGDYKPVPLFSASHADWVYVERWLLEQGAGYSIEYLPPKDKKTEGLFSVIVVDSRGIGRLATHVHKLSACCQAFLKAYGKDDDIIRHFEPNEREVLGTSLNRGSLFDEKYILPAIRRERDYQDNKWGTIESNPHSIYEWIGIMERELAEAKDAFFKRPSESEMLREVLQVVSVGVACLEQHGVVERQ